MTEKYYIPLHTIKYPDVAAAKLPVCCSLGYLWGGPDRRGANAPHPGDLWRAWQEEVKKFVKNHEAFRQVPQDVMDYFQETKGFSGPPKEEVRTVFTTGTPEKPGEVILATGPLPRFATSYTGMTQFLQCPLQWAAAKFYKELPFVETEAIKWGNLVHAACEMSLKGNATPEQQALVAQTGADRYIQAMLASGGELLVEHEMCFTRNLDPCGWKDWDTVWFRGKADVVILQGPKATVFDWKTGSRFDKDGRCKADLFQLDVMFASLSLTHPEVEEFHGRLIYLKEKPENQIVRPPEPTLKEDLPAIWEKIFDITNRMQEAWAAEIFRAQPSGLCKSYCGYTKCAHCGKGVRK